ncbi:MAG TPA: DUF4230 domain-containing protein [Sphingomicrobium sp.]|nr:DUF4230 domain-containing protein [Sphingomicrobium sp.]
MVEHRLNKPWVIVAIAAALVVGLLIGVGSGLAGRIFGGPNPKTIASSSLESMRAQNRLIAFVARYVSVTSSQQSRFGFSAERTLILPGDVRYEVDLSKLRPEDVKWDDGTRTLRVRLPEIEIAGPEVDLAAAREYGDGKFLATLMGAEDRLDQANRARAVADLRKQASAELPMRLAREAARQAIERSFALPLNAAGFDDVKVVARFAAEGGSSGGPYLDASRSYNEVLDEARAKREGRRTR